MVIGLFRSAGNSVHKLDGRQESSQSEFLVQEALHLRPARHGLDSLVDFGLTQQGHAPLLGAFTFFALGR
jgi:hypothetical protein